MQHTAGQLHLDNCNRKLDEGSAAQDQRQRTRVGAGGASAGSVSMIALAVIVHSWTPSAPAVGT
jgi:hypothetical protein